MSSRLIKYRSSRGRREVPTYSKWVPFKSLKASIRLSHQSVSNRRFLEFYKSLVQERRRGDRAICESEDMYFYCPTYRRLELGETIPTRGRGKNVEEESEYGESSYRFGGGHLGDGTE